MIEKTLPRYHEVQAIRAASKGTGKGKKKNKSKGKAVTQANEDEEMEDAPHEQAMASLDDMEVELTNAGNTPASVDKGKGKLQNPVNFGELPYVGGKRESQGKKDDSP